MHELRTDGRTLTGVAVRYGDTSKPVFARTRGRMVAGERIEPGAFGDIGAVVLELEHRADRPVAMLPGALELTDTDAALELRAELPETEDADAILAGVQSGKLRGLSVDMRVEADRMEGATRVIERATLYRIAVVPRGAYRSSQFELRQAIGEFDSVIPADINVHCQCHRGGEDTVRFTPDSLRNAVRDAVADAESGERDVLAIAGDNKLSALASLRRGTLALNNRDDGSIGVRFDVPDTPAGDALRELASGAVDVFARPLFDAQRSTFSIENGVAVYSDLWLRSILVGSTTETLGWQAATFAARGGR